MVLYINRREAEMIIESLKGYLNGVDDGDYKIVIDRLERVTELQCKNDNSTFKGGKFGVRK